MSLKRFHLVFITAAALLAFGFGWMELSAYGNGAGVADLAVGSLASAAGGLLVGYEVWFFRKSRKLYLF